MPTLENSKKSENAVRELVIDKLMKNGVDLPELPGPMRDTALRLRAAFPHDASIQECVRTLLREHRRLIGAINDNVRKRQSECSPDHA